MTPAFIITVTSVSETQDLARELGAAIKSGDFIILTGDLGAGKTYFTQGLAAGLDVTAAVTSPTYTIVNIYGGRVPLYHFDLYRLNQPEELEAIGCEDYFFNNNGVVVAEWGDKFPGLLPDNYLTIHFHRLTNDADAREVKIIAHGKRARELADEIRAMSQQLALKIERA